MLDQFLTFQTAHTRDLIHKMAKKTCARAHRETVNRSRRQETLSDEIALRDEILDLKRQVVILKRANEQCSVRLRKYEDEAKRKDKQLEQLMNPRKNADVAKILSTKGAAILMNLKDQNNALVQMLLNRDLQIRRLAAEVKMSKLYASTKRHESYKAEITRLRNLLIKSEEILRENIEEQQEQTRSICVSENPISEFSSSSDHSSPRDLDELRSTVYSLEAHIKHSNDLLAQKNQQISILSDELHFLRRYFRYKTSKVEMSDCDRFSAKTFTRSWPGPLNAKNLSSQDLLDIFEKNRSNECEDLCRSAPAGTAATLPSDKYTTEPEMPPTACPRNVPGDLDCAEAAAASKGGALSAVPAVGKSLFHSLAAEEVLKETMPSKTEGPPRFEGKWKRALKKYKELKRFNPQLIAGGDQNRNEISSKFIDSKARESETTEKDFQREKTVDEDENYNPIGKPTSEGLFEKVDNCAFPTGNENPNDEDVTSELAQTFEDFSNSESTPRKESRVDEDIRATGSSPDEEESKTSPRIHFEDAKPEERKSLRDVYRQSLDSSFDSENSYPTKQEVRVEVQINSVSHQNYTDRSEKSISESDQGSHASQTGEGTREGGSHARDFEFNDDDDVVVR